MNVRLVTQRSNRVSTCSIEQDVPKSLYVWWKCKRTHNRWILLCIKWHLQSTPSKKLPYHIQEEIFTPDQYKQCSLPLWLSMRLSCLKQWILEKLDLKEYNKFDDHSHHWLRMKCACNLVRLQIPTQDKRELRSFIVALCLWSHADLTKRFIHTANMIKILFVGYWL